jgi:acetylornithine deacetylase/succinyl-diaminopimelate desuccinylase family protein
MKDLIDAYFAEHEDVLRQKLIALTKEMCREKTINVPSSKLSEHPFLKIRGEEYKVAAIVKRELSGWNIPFAEYARQEGRPNVIGRIGSGRKPVKLLMPAHMDIVPAGKGWTTDPFEPIEKNGFIYGRGVLDNKGPLASCLIAGMVMKQVIGDKNIQGQMLIAALADEEATDPDGIDYGIGYLLEEKLIDPTYAIIPDIGENMKKIDIAEKGRAVIRIVNTGKQAHGSTPERGINAIYPMARLVLAIETLKLDFIPHPLLISPTINLGEIHGGAAANIVPGDCHIILDIRTLPGQSREQITQVLSALCQQCGGDFAIHIDAWSDAHKIDPDNDLVRSIQANAQTVLGFTPEPFGMGGGTYAKTLNLKGVKAVGFGPGDDQAFHVADEYVEVKQLLDFAKLTCLVAIDLLQ